MFLSLDVEHYQDVRSLRLLGSTSRGVSRKEHNRRTRRADRVLCRCSRWARVYYLLPYWRGVSDYQMQVREGWKTRCLTVQVGMVFFGLIGLVVSATGVLVYRQAMRSEHGPQQPPTI